MHRKDLLVHILQRRSACSRPPATPYIPLPPTSPPRFICKSCICLRLRDALPPSKMWRVLNGVTGERCRKGEALRRMRRGSVASTTLSARVFLRACASRGQTDDFRVGNLWVHYRRDLPVAGYAERSRTGIEITAGESWYPSTRPFPVCGQGGGSDGGASSFILCGVCCLEVAHARRRASHPLPPR